MPLKKNKSVKFNLSAKCQYLLAKITSTCFEQTSFCHSKTYIEFLAKFLISGTLFYD
jgi:hypothetical protein